MNASNLAALGFLTLGDRFMGMQHDIINDRIDVVTKDFSGSRSLARVATITNSIRSPRRLLFTARNLREFARPEIEPAISKIKNTTDYQDYFKKRTALTDEKEQLEARFRELRRKRDRQGIQQLQRDIRRNSTAVAELEMTHAGAPVRAMAVEDNPNPRNSPRLHSWRGAKSRSDCATAVPGGAFGPDTRRVYQRQRTPPARARHCR
jgi:hypothetical protein